jgi:hypothetical protein
MSDTTYQYVENTGIIVVDTSTVLTEVQGEWIAAFGDGLNIDSSTPQGVIISAEVSARSNVIKNNAAVANQINPNQAEGVFLDAICALTGLERNPTTYTTVENVLLTGVQNTLVPAGSLVETAAGDQFDLTADVTLETFNGSTWTGIGEFQAVQGGPVPCGTGSNGLVNLVTDVLGWETVSNASAGVVGTLQQTDGVLRALRRQTLFLQGVSLIGAILSAVADITGVIGFQGLENYTSAPQTISGVYMVANSVWVCVDGGAQADIATALLVNKSLGCAWNGAQSVSVIEPSSGQTYTVLYDVPTSVPLLISVTAKQGSFVGNPTTAIMQAIIDFGNNAIQPADPNAEPVQGFGVGQSASPFEIGAGITQECPGIYLRAILISTVAANNLQPDEIPLDIYQKATITADDITIVIVT